MPRGLRTIAVCAARDRRQRRRARAANMSEGFPGESVAGEWVELELADRRKGYLRTSVVRETAGRWNVMASTTPRDDVINILNVVRHHSAALEAQANELEGGRKVKFSGEFKHYGADRTARERDLDLGQEGGAPTAGAPAADTPPR